MHAAKLSAVGAWIAIGPGGRTVDFVAAAASGAQTVYASSNLGGVFLSEDAGATWRAANSGLCDLRIQCLAVPPVDSRTVYAGAYGGGFKTTDQGSAGDGLGNPSVLSLALLPDGTLLAGTNGGSIFELVGAAEREPVARVGGRPGTRVLPARP